MQLVHHLAARRLVQTVDVLGHHGFALALALQFGQPQMGGIRLGPVDDELLAVKIVKFGRVGLVKRMGEHRLGRILEFLVVQPIYRAKIRDAALGRNARPAEKYKAAGIPQNFFQCRYHTKFPFRFLLKCFIMYLSL